MQRIVILGNAGSGKSTLARRGERQIAAFVEGLTHPAPAARSL
ncbi:hypothetical protein Q1J61_26780 [Pseudomonas putida]